MRDFEHDDVAGLDVFERGNTAFSILRISIRFCVSPSEVKMLRLNISENGGGSKLRMSCRRRARAQRRCGNVQRRHGKRAILPAALAASCSGRAERRTISSASSAPARRRSADSRAAGDRDMREPNSSRQRSQLGRLKKESLPRSSTSGCAAPNSARSRVSVCTV